MHIRGIGAGSVRPAQAGSVLYALAVCVIALLLSDAVFATVYSTGAAGRTKGSYATSATGAATYSIPIWAPPGPHGMTPSIALTSTADRATVMWAWVGASAV
jgi:hypothetical protein